MTSCDLNDVANIELKIELANGETKTFNKYKTQFQNEFQIAASAYKKLGYQL